MMYPYFSIIIPAYNVCAFIEKAINSCLHQEGVDESEYEIIVIDDGSNDGTSSIVDLYSNYNNIRVIHQSNSGLSATRNKGVKIAKGLYIVYLDGDDWLHPQALRVLKDSNQEDDVIVFPMIYSYESGEEITKSYGLEERTYNSKQFAELTLGQAQFNITPAPCKIYRRSFLINNSISFIEGILHEDGPFFIDVLFHVKNIRYIDKGLYYYRQGRKDSITTKKPTLRNFDGIVKGQEHTIQMTGLKDKAINTYLLYMNVFQVLMEYDPNCTFRNIAQYYRRMKIRKRMLIASLHSKANLKFRLLGIALFLDPSIPKFIQKCLK